MCQTPQETPDSTDEDEWENTVTIRAKWSYDGAKTIDEIIERLHEQIEHFTQMKAEGWELISEIQDDWGHAKQRS